MSIGNVAVAAGYAEMIVSPDYRHALNTAFSQSESEYVAQRNLAHEIALGGLSLKDSGEQRWEIRRQAALTQMGSVQLGTFNTYFQQLGGESTPTNLTVDDLDKGTKEVVGTNARILGLNEVYKDPIQFLDNSLEIIAERGKRDGAGPENYTTALKIFTDKYHALHSASLDREEVADLVNRCMDGFVRIARRDPPNFIEMTNIYYAIRGLPVGTFDDKFTPILLTYSLEQLPYYTKGTLSLLIASLGKMDLTEVGETAATLFDLAIRKSGACETTGDMRSLLRVIVNLPDGPATDRAFNTFLEYRSDLEQSMDIEGLDEVNERLLSITRHVIDEPHLVIAARELARDNAERAVRLFRSAQHHGEMTDTQLGEKKKAVQRTVLHFNSIRAAVDGRI